MYCIYSLFHTDEYARRVADSGDNAFSEPDEWKFEDGKCSNPDCKYIHDRQRFIEDIKANPLQYVLDLIKFSIMLTDFKISRKVYIPLPKEKLNDSCTIICMAPKTHCTCRNHDYDKQCEYLNTNGWYFIYHISDFVSKILRVCFTDLGACVIALSKLFWKAVSVIQGKKFVDEGCKRHCRYWLITKKCIHNDRCKYSHDTKALIEDMKKGYKEWKCLIDHSLMINIRRKIRISMKDILIPFDDMETIEKCISHVKNYIHCCSTCMTSRTTEEFLMWFSRLIRLEWYDE